jgi:hypothetical protein
MMIGIAMHAEEGRRRRRTRRRRRRRRSRRRRSFMTVYHYKLVYKLVTQR